MQSHGTQNLPLCYAGGKFLFSKPATTFLHEFIVYYFVYVGNYDFLCLGSGLERNGCYDMSGGYVII